MPETLTELDFSVEDEVDGRPLTPDNVPLPLLRSFLEEIEDFVKGDVPGITLKDSRVKIEEGSLKVVAFIGAALAFNVQQDLQTLKNTGDLDQIQSKRAQVVEKWQSRAEKHPKRAYFIGRNVADGGVQITSRSQFEHGNEKAWVRVEKYFTGKVYNAGGKQDPNIHLELHEGGSLTVGATEKQLSAIPDNLLFKTMTVRVQAEQHLQSKRLRNVQLLEIMSHSAEIDEDALDNLWRKGAEAWKDVESASGWVEQIRGNS